METGSHHEERGSIRQDGTIEDRRRAQWVWPVVVGFLVLLIVMAASATVFLKAKYDGDRRDEGRRDSTLIFCGIASGIVEQGQVLLVSGTLRRGDTLEGVPPAATRSTLLTSPIDDVVRLYVPGPISKEIDDASDESFKRRLTAARLASQQYAQGISDVVSRVAHTRRQVVPPGSTGIDCDKILEIAQVG